MLYTGVARFSVLARKIKKSTALFNTQLALKAISKLKILRIEKKEAYRDGIKKGDKIGMGYMKHG